MAGSFEITALRSGSFEMEALEWKEIGLDKTGGVFKVMVVKNEIIV